MLSPITGIYQTDYKPIVIKQGDHYEDDVFYIGFKGSHEYGGFYSDDLCWLLKDPTALTIGLQVCDFVESFDPYSLDGDDCVKSVLEALRHGNTVLLLEALQEDLEMLLEDDDDPAMIEECKRVIALLA